MHLVTTKGAPPRGEAPSELSRASPRVFGDRGSEARAPAPMPIGSHESTEGSVFARARWRRGRASVTRGARQEMHATATSRGYRRRRTASTPTMGNQRGTADDELSRAAHLGVRTGVDAAGAFSPLLIPWERQARNDSSAPREHEGDLGGTRCWPRRSLLTHRTALAPAGPGGERATRGAIGACSVDHRGESWRIRPSARWKMRNNEVAEACLSDPSPSVDHESANERHRTGSADGLRSE